jgi:hypothetical protein
VKGDMRMSMIEEFEMILSAHPELTEKMLAFLENLKQTSDSQG